MLKRLTILLLSFAVITNFSVIKSSAEVVQQVTEDKLKTYVGTVILSAGGVNLDGIAMKEKTGKELTELLITNNQIKFGTSNGLVTYQELITSEGLTTTSWDKSFQLLDGYAESTMDFINTIPTEPTELPIHPGNRILSITQNDGLTYTFNYEYNGVVPTFTVKNYYNGNLITSRDLVSIYAGSGFKELGTYEIRVTTHSNGINLNIYYNDERRGYYYTEGWGGTGRVNTVDLRTGNFASVVDIPYSPTITSEKDKDKLTTNIPVGSKVSIPNVSLENITGEGITTWDSCIVDLVAIKSPPSKSSTITINANVEPYLETTLSTSTLDITTIAGQDSLDSLTLSVKSNLNYKVESKFSRLHNTDRSSVIGIDKFKLLSESVSKDLVLGEYSILEDNQTFGDKIHNLSIKIENSKIIKSDTYSGSLEFKVSQL